MVWTNGQATLLKTHSTGADVARLKLKEKLFPAVAAVSGLQFQTSVTTIDHYWLLMMSPASLSVPCTSAETVAAAEVRQ